MPSVVAVTRTAGLDVVEETVRREVDAQQRRADAVDGKAGLVLGFAGIFVSLGAGFVPAPFALAARVVASAAALLALAAFVPRPVPHLSLVEVRRRLGRDPERTRALVLDSLIVTYATIEASVATKVAYLRRAVRLLTVALVVVVLGASVETWSEVIS